MAKRSRKQKKNTRTVAAATRGAGKRRYTGAQRAMLVAGVIIIMSMVLSGIASVFSGPLF